MDARSLHPAGRSATASALLHDDTIEAGSPVALGPACCCPANPVVRVIMPATASPSPPHRAAAVRASLPCLPPGTGRSQRHHRPNPPAGGKPAGRAAARPSGCPRPSRAQPARPAHGAGWGLKAPPAATGEPQANRTRPRPFPRGPVRAADRRGTRADRAAFPGRSAVLMPTAAPWPAVGRTPLPPSSAVSEPQADRLVTGRRSSQPGRGHPRRWRPPWSHQSLLLTLCTV